jgi:excisionase family DNA binding protein
VFSEAVATAKVPVLDVASRYQELGEALRPVINPAVTAKYGLEIPSFIVENVSVPPEVEQAIDKRSSMAAVGNLNDYVKYQMAQGMAEPGGGLAASAAQLGAGLAMGQQIAQGLSQTTPTSPPANSPPPAAPGSGASPGAAGVGELMSPADAAKVLGVNESDVLTALGDGSLKGKKIGTAWRITRSGLDEFLKS